MKTVMKKMFSLLLVAVLLVSALPFAASAAETAKIVLKINGEVVDTVTGTFDSAPTTFALLEQYNKVDLTAVAGATFSHTWKDGMGNSTAGKEIEINPGEEIHVAYTKEVHQHTPNIAAPDCTHDQVCTSCGKLLQSKLGHAFNPNAKCTDAKPCTRNCGYTAPAGTCTPGAAATCTTPQTCTVCKAQLAPAKGHTFVATCTTAETCSVCGAAGNSPELGHTWILDSETAATCTTAGSKEYHCGVTGCTATKSEPIAALGHNIGSNGVCDRPNCGYEETTKYQVDFYLDYNSNNAKPDTTKAVAKGTKVYGIYTPSRKGYTFEGWYTFSGTRVSEDATVTGDSAYFAKWTQINPEEVYVKFYTHGNTKTPVKYVDLYHYAHDGVITLSELKEVAEEYFEPRDDGELYVFGPFTSSQWDIYSENTAYRNTREKIEVSTTDTTVIHAMVRNVADSSSSSSSSSKADSTNPKTGDMIFAPAIVMGASVSALAVLFYLNKKRTVM